MRKASFLGVLSILRLSQDQYSSLGFLNTGELINNMVESMVMLAKEHEVLFSGEEFDEDLLEDGDASGMYVDDY